MARALILAISAWAFCFLGPALWAHEEPVQQSTPHSPIIGLVTADRVNLRAGPGQAYEILLVMDRGSRMEVWADHQGWYAVRLPEEIPVYAHRSMLKVEGQTAKVQGDRVHLRAGAGLSSAPVGHAGRASELKIRSWIGEWAQVDPPAQCRGWVHEGYLTLLKSERD